MGIGENQRNREKSRDQLDGQISAFLHCSTEG
ncbi:hypothetical protein J2W98_004359 [Paenibacillus peoriae]|jgi:hypothetical protein|uniref:Uncharacterized protein n=1 Tax=Paenibacillus peoriae TaxID=59893 RepID=A0ABU1QLK3_9BACL|nr:hypothetical protein [Paenibacillus sp. PvR133]MDR6780064.1 hypothetical protein [Paenibacillus peoriae]SFR24366.1 hypothetical protein SAMN04488603_108131 [Paenibacillus sp. cl130]